ncbi:MAG: hypothetical protein AAF640_07985 [Pseudomonadota bacterium]
MSKDKATFCASGAARCAALVLGLGGAAAVHAEGASPGDNQSLIENTFSQVTAREVRTLGERTMIETEGELWPRAFSPSAVGRPLATYEWITVVPGVIGPWRGGVCTSCNSRNRIPL